jgi:vancomycin resistance protein YoaR
MPALKVPANDPLLSSEQPSKIIEESTKKVQKAQEPAEKKKNGWLVFMLRAGAVTILLLSFLFISFSGAVYAYHGLHKEVALHGQKILGIDVGGKTAPEIKNILNERVGAVRLYFKVDGEELAAKPEEAGINFKVNETAETIIEKNNVGNFYDPWLKKSKAVINFFSSEPLLPLENADIDYEVDREKLGNFAQNLSSKFGVESKNAGLVMSGTEVEVIPAVYGRKIIVDSIEHQLKSSLKGINSLNVPVEVEKVSPSIIEDDTRETIAQAKSLFSLPVAYRYQDKTFTPDRATVASWVVFNTTTVDGKEKLTPAFDAKRVYPYIYSLANKINVPAINKKVTVKNGTEQVIEQEGKEGLAVDVDQASLKTAQALTAGKPVDLSIPTYVVKFKTNVNNVVVANWEKYITIDISEQKMCAYLAGGIQVSCWSITSGASSKGYATPLGTFLIQRKSGAGGAPGQYGGGVCMPNPPSATPLCGINYVSYFTSKGHAIHEAWWRSPGASNDFGNPNWRWNGSHGCINSPYSVAQFIYNWAPIGTPVIISA